MGHSSFPLLAAFHCTLKPPIPMGYKISHRVPFLPVSSWGTFPSHIIFLDSWGTCPSHCHLQLKYPTLQHTWSRSFNLTAQNILLYLNISVQFQYLYIAFYHGALIHPIVSGYLFLLFNPGFFISFIQLILPSQYPGLSLH